MIPRHRIHFGIPLQRRLSVQDYSKSLHFILTPLHRMCGGNAHSRRWWNYARTTLLARVHIVDC
jgi:hypothetical protein